MKRRILQVILLGLCLLNYSCQGDDEVAYVKYVPKVVIDGWIENGSPAQVIMTWTAPFDQPLDTTFLLSHVIKAARVSVSDGERTEILTLGVDNNYLPPYLYYGENIIGEEGKTYDLRIEYRDEVLTARTLIPKAIPLTDCRIETKSPEDEVGYIRIMFKHQAETYYQAATRIVNKETFYTPCLYGNIPPKLFGADESVSIQLHKGPILFPEFEFKTEFAVQDTILLKFRTQNKASYDFWTSWQNEVLNAQNPIFPARTNLKSNIEGGIGVWSGYGTYTYLYQDGEWQEY